MRHRRNKGHTFLPVVKEFQVFMGSRHGNVCSYHGITDEGTFGGWRETFREGPSHLGVPCSSI